MLENEYFLSGANVCKSCRSRQEFYSEYLAFIWKNRLRYSRGRASPSLEVMQFTSSSHSLAKMFKYPPRNTFVLPISCLTFLITTQRNSLVLKMAILAQAISAQAEGVGQPRRRLRRLLGHISNRIHRDTSSSIVIV